MAFGRWPAARRGGNQTDPAQACLLGIGFLGTRASRRQAVQSAARPGRQAAGISKATNPILRHFQFVPSPCQKSMANDQARMTKEIPTSKCLGRVFKIGKRSQPECPIPGRSDFHQLGAHGITKNLWLATWLWPRTATLRILKTHPNASVWLSLRTSSFFRH